MINEKVLLHQARHATQRFLDILFPPQCAGCKKSGTVLCSSCLANFSPAVSPLCQQCGILLSAPGICKRCYYHPLGLSGLRTVSAYEGPLRFCIHALKYDGNVRLAEPLGDLLAKAYLQYGLQADIIIPVPLHAERQQQRGYNHAQLLAEVCAARVQIPLYSN